MHTLGVLCPQGHMRVTLLTPASPGIFGGSLVKATTKIKTRTLKPALWGVITFQPDYWLYTVRLALFPKIIGPIQVTVIGHGDSGHSLFFCRQKKVI